MNEIIRTVDFVITTLIFSAIFAVNIIRGSKKTKENKTKEKKMTESDIIEILKWVAIAHLSITKFLS